MVFLNTHFKFNNFKCLIPNTNIFPNDQNNSKCVKHMRPNKMSKGTPFLILS